MTMTDRDKKILLLLLPLVLLGAIWFGLLAPKRDEAADLSDKVANAQADRDRVESEARAAKTVKSNYGRDYATVVRLGKATPTELDMPSLIVQLDQAARGTKIRFSKVASGDDAGGAPSTGDSSSASSSSSGSTPPVQAGGEKATTGPGKTVEKANDGAASANDASSKAGGSAGGGDSGSSSSGSSTPAPSSSGTPAPSSSSSSTPAPAPTGSSTDAETTSEAGLKTVPLTFTFNGSFFELADFFHEMKRFVRTANGRIDIRGRLLTIDSFSWKSEADKFPIITAEVKASVYLAAKDTGATAGATPSGPAGATPAPASEATPPTGGATSQPASTAGAAQ